MSQLKTDEDSLDWGRKTWRNRKTFSVGRKQTGIHSGYSWHFRALNEITSYPRLRLEWVLAERGPLPLGLRGPSHLPLLRDQLLGWL